jgi:aspartyl-tRNA(Asn)/glutamyl-tRNA(Gln) amidotransferase subunit B
MNWEMVIGLEVHVQLATTSKIFSGASTQYGAEPNTQACLVDLGMPGTLPVLNKKAVELAVKFGVAIGAHINQRNVFDRKNYFYPDLPKGYQISQLDLPIVGEGHLDILVNGDTKRIGVTRAHLEEDAGKSIHDKIPGCSGIDLNRAGTPLLEIVSEPDLRSAQEVISYLKTLHSLVRFIDISDGNMQEGSFRCDVNISMRPAGQKELGTRAELKNLNSFRFIEKAIAVEVERQIDILEAGGTVVQETRLYDSDLNETRSMRSKEEAFDYRYFPDPDLLPVDIEDSFIETIRASLPELPQAKRDRFVSNLGLSQDDAALLVSDKHIAGYFEALHDKTGEPKLAANWINTEVLGYLNKQQISFEQNPVAVDTLATLISRVSDNTISNSAAKKVFVALCEGETDVDAVIEAKGLKQISDTGALEKMVDDIIAANPNQVAQYRAGKEKVFGFFVGQVMKHSKGQANPGEVNKLLKSKLTK